MRGLVNSAVVKWKASWQDSTNMRCAYLTFQPAENDVNIWSGLNYHIRQCLEQTGFEVTHLGGLGLPPSLKERLKARFYRHVAKRGYDFHRDPTYLRRCAAATSRRLEENDGWDFILAPSSYPVSYLHTQKPKLVWADATFAGLVNYYPEFGNLCHKTLRDGLKAEARALQDCAAVIFSSSWAAETAKDQYRLQSSKVHVIPFGANVESPYQSRDDAARAVAARDTNRINFLFFGVDWERKGGRFAEEVIKRLISAGVQAHLTVVGCRPTDVTLGAEQVTIEGFLNKADGQGQARLRQILSNTHFLILPTRAEAYGLVFAEAAAYAVPSLAFRTGGVPTLVQDRETGVLFDLADTADAWSDVIAGLIQRQGLYSRMALAAYDRYESVLNWKTSAKSFAELINNIQGCSALSVGRST